MGKKSSKKGKVPKTVANPGNGSSNAVKGVNPARGEVDAAIARSARDTRNTSAASKPLAGAKTPLKPPKKLGRTPKT